MRRLQEEPSYWAKGRGLMTAGVEGFVDAGTCCWKKKYDTPAAFLRASGTESFPSFDSLTSQVHHHPEGSGPSGNC